MDRAQDVWEWFRRSIRQAVTPFLKEHDSCVTGEKEQRRVRHSIHVRKSVMIKALILAAAAAVLYVPLFAGYKARAAAADSMVDDRKIAITFDDGPHPYYTEQLLDGLKERGVKATFFVMGKNVEQYPELVERMHNEGHLIGNHTYSHIQLNRGNGDSFKEELIKTSELIEELTGQEVQYVRPPYGSWIRSSRRN